MPFLVPVLLLLLAEGAGPVAAGGDLHAGRAAAAVEGGRHLARRQGPDGAVPRGWRPDQVAEAVVALAAGGDQPEALRRAVAFLRVRADAAATTGPYTGRIVSGLVAAGEDPRRFGGVDLVARLESFHDPVSGGYGGDNLYADTLAMAALLAAGGNLPEASVRRLHLNQCDDGGWSHRIGCLGPPDADTTAMATAVLAAATGSESSEVRAGRGWLLRAQRPSGCWGLEAGDVANANSCGLVLAALAGLGEDAAAAPWTDGGRDPVAALRSLQLPSGAFAYQAGGDADDYATIQAVPGLAAWPQPLRSGLTPAAAALATATGGPAPHAPSSAGQASAAGRSGPEGAPAGSPAAVGQQGPIAAAGGDAARRARAQSLQETSERRGVDPGAARSAPSGGGTGSVALPAAAAVAALTAVAAGGWRWRRSIIPAAKRPGGADTRADGDGR